MIDRRTFLGSALAAPLCASPLLRSAPHEPGSTRRAGPMRFGLCTYLWGKDWKLPQLIENCAAAGALGVELRTTHAHGVERSLSKDERAEVRKRFADSEVELVGLGSDERFDNPDPDRLAAAVAATKEFLVLSHDVGGTGVKVKPDSFHKGVDHEVTIRQIGETLAALGPFAHNLGQEIRVEVHGQCQRLPTMKQILDIADHPSVVVCWNSNPQDLLDDGIDANFALVRPRLGGTVHVRELQDPDYPYARLVELLIDAEYGGWVLMEARSKQADLVVALREQAERFEFLVKAAEFKRKAKAAGGGR